MAHLRVPPPPRAFPSAAARQVELEIVAKAIDGDFNSQPEKMSHTYNVLGICVNHWHRVKVTVDPRFSSDSPDIPTAEPVPPPGYYNARHSAKT